MFEIGDQVAYTPFACKLLYVNQRPWDIGIVVGIEGKCIKVKFINNHQRNILPFWLMHHPYGPKVIRRQMRAVIPEIIRAVESRVAALVFSELTGHTAQRGLGPADIVRSFLDPRPIRKSRY